MLCTLFFLANCQQDYSDGQVIYEKQCASCHGAQGQGLNELIPPLAGSNWLTDPSLRMLIPCAIKKGMNGKILVNGKEYEGVMQAFPSLSDIDINNVMNYMAQNWGNTAEPFVIPNTRKALEYCK
jgi:mono/diheme cytochrome c family protein